MTRLSPTRNIIRKLFANSGNQCAFPGCDHILIDDEDFVGQICHIEAANEGGERYNEDQSDEERRGYGNLVLFCYKHHIKTNNVDEFTVEKLKRIKDEHESKFRGSNGFELPKEFDSKILDQIEGRLEKILEFVESTRNNTAEIFDLLKNTLSGASVSLSYSNQELYSDRFSDITVLRKKGQIETALELMLKFQEENWANIDDALKEKSILNLAGIYLELSQQKNAAECLLGLEKLAGKGEELTANLCLAYCIMGERAKFESKATEQNLYKSENITFWTAFLILYKDTYSFVEICEAIPSKLLSDPQIMINLADICFESNEKEKGFKYLELAINNLPADISDRWLLQNWVVGKALSAIATKEKVHLKSFTLPEKEKLQWCLTNLSEIWNYVGKNEIRNYAPTVIYNRGIIYKYLGNDIEAKNDLEESWAIDKKFSFFQGLYFHLTDMNMDEEVEKLFALSNLIIFDSIEEEREYDLLLSFYFSKKGQITESVDLLKTRLEKTDGLFRLELLNLICITYFNASIYAPAREFVDQTIEEFPDQPDGYLHHFELFEGLNKGKSAISSLDKAYQIAISNDCRKYNLMFVIGRELYHIERFYEAADCFERIYTHGQFDEIGINLWKSYFHSGQYEKVKTFYEGLTELDRNDPIVNDLLLHVYENEGNLEEARKLLENNLVIQSGRAKDHFCKRAIHFYKFIGDIRALIKLIKDIEVTENYSLRERFHMANLLMENNEPSMGLDLAYDTRLHFYDLKEAHEAYIPLIAINGSKNRYEDSIFPASVNMDCGVYLKNRKGEENYYFLTDNKDIAGTNIIRSNEPIAKLFLGKKVGDDILFSNSIGINAVQKISQIIDKHTHAFRESMQILETKYPDQTSFKVIRTEDGDPQTLIGYLEAQLIETNRHNLEIANLYNNNIFPIGVVQQWLKISYIETWFRLLGSPETPIYSVGENISEAIAFSSGEKRQKIVMELSGMLTLLFVFHRTDFLQEFEKFDIIIAAETLVELRDYQWQLLSKDSGVTLGIQNGKTVGHQLHFDEIESLRITIGKLIEWCESNTKIQSPKLYNNRYKELRKIAGASTVDTLLLAKEEGAALMSDDERFKQLAAEEFKIQSFGSYTFLYDLYGRKSIDEETFNELKYKLILENYVFIPVDNTILWKSFEESGYRIQKPFTSALNGLNCLDKSVLAKVFVYFSKDLYMNLALQESIEMVLTRFLAQIKRRNDYSEILLIINREIPEVFRFMPLHAERLKALINSFK